MCPDNPKPVSPLFEKLNPPYHNPEQAHALFTELLEDKTILHPVLSIGNQKPEHQAHYRLFRTASFQEIQEGQLDNLIDAVGSGNLLLLEISKNGPCSVYVRDYLLQIPHRLR